MEIKKIVYATDFSEGSAVALPYAVDLAKLYGAKLYLVHVIYDFANTTGWYVPHISLDSIYKDMEAAAREQLEKCYIEDMKGVKEIERVVLTGVPYQEITKFTKDQKIDLIVLGTHGRKGIDRVVFGSTVEQISRNVPCPVFTVRIPEHQQS